MKRNQSGFTLAEMAIAFVIIALLLIAGLTPLTTQKELRDATETKRVQELVKEAILGFALANGRLPCAAYGATASGTTQSGGVADGFAAGAEAYSTATKKCILVQGIVPFATLGVPEVDGFGRRLSYRVSPAFADDFQSTSTYNTSTTTVPASPADQSPTCTPSPTPSRASFGLCSLGDIAVWTRDEYKRGTSALASGLPVAIISHGKNGYGAFQVTGFAVVAPPAVNVDETTNTQVSGNQSLVNGYIQYAYMSRNRTTEGSGCSDTVDSSPMCEYDDVVTWIPTNVLISRMVQAGRLP